MSYSLAVAALSFILGLFPIGFLTLRILRHYRIGKQIRLEGPSSHSGKAGTLTMGGIMIFVTVFLVNTVFNLVGRWSILLPAAVIVSTGTLGAVDDLLNLVGGAHRGMTARFKAAWLLAIATIAALILHFFLDLRSVYIPFVGKYEIGLLYLPIAMFAIHGTANAVNLTDGLDGLAGGMAAIAFVCYGIIAFLQGQAYLVTFCFSVAGACLAFLWFNAHPARVFMGDTGSLALGASLATVALMTGQWLLLPVVGFVFVVEALSVMLQVAYFKRTKGRRLLKMSPLHHHFELIGWSETQVTIRFWLVGMVCGMVGVALALS